MNFRKLLPIYLMAASPFFIACESDDDDDDSSGSGSTTNCSVTITSSDAPSVNDLFILTEGDDSNLNVDSLLDLSGTSQTWDFSDLIEGTDSDSILFQDKSIGSLASSYPTADFAFVDDESEMYFQVKSNGLDIIGADFGDDEDVDVEITNSISYIPYILEMGKTITDPFEIQATTLDTIDTVIGGFAISNQPVVVEITQSNANDFIVDGCGTVITPTGTYECLRYYVETGESEIEGTISGNNPALGGDFSFAIPAADLDDADMEFNIFEAKTFFYINKATGFPVVMIEVDDTGNVDHIQYLK